LGEDVVRHSLRHTATTWLMQQGTDRWQAAGWLGMTLEQLEDGYGHHHPDFQEEAAEAFGGRARAAR
jgi:integrase